MAIASNDVPPATDQPPKRPNLRPSWPLLRNLSVGAAVCIWLAASVLLFTYPNSPAWLWATLVSIIALTAAAFAVIMDRRPPRN